jgi:hypothetical protein
VLSFNKAAHAILSHKTRLYTIPYGNTRRDSEYKERRLLWKGTPSRLKLEDAVTVVAGGGGVAVVEGHAEVGAAGIVHEATGIGATCNQSRYDNKLRQRV